MAPTLDKSPKAGSSTLELIEIDVRDRSAAATRRRDFGGAPNPMHAPTEPAEARPFASARHVDLNVGPGPAVARRTSRNSFTDRHDSTSWPASARTELPGRYIRPAAIVELLRRPITLPPKGWRLPRY